MLYLSGDNNLSSEMIWALKEIEDQGLPDGFEMTILYDALSPCSPSYVYDLSGQSETGPEGAEAIDPARIPPLPLPRMKDAKPSCTSGSKTRVIRRRFANSSNGASLNEALPCTAC